MAWPFSHPRPAASTSLEWPVLMRLAKSVNEKNARIARAPDRHSLYIHVLQRQFTASVREAMFHTEAQSWSQPQPGLLQRQISVAATVEDDFMMDLELDVDLDIEHILDTLEIPG